MRGHIIELLVLAAIVVLIVFVAGEVRTIVAVKDMRAEEIELRCGEVEDFYERMTCKHRIFEERRDGAL
jgi:hypothetical protein